MKSISLLLLLLACLDGRPTCQAKHLPLHATLIASGIRVDMGELWVKRYHDHYRQQVSYLLQKGNSGNFYQ